LRETSDLSKSSLNSSQVPLRVLKPLLGRLDRGFRLRQPGRADAPGLFEPLARVLVSRQARLDLVLREFSLLTPWSRAQHLERRPLLRDLGFGFRELRPEIAFRQAHQQITLTDAIALLNEYFFNRSSFRFGLDVPIALVGNGRIRQPLRAHGTKT
jgi:hypothetical protein